MTDSICGETFTGIDKPEPLVVNLAGLWSRRIDEMHRLVYEVDEVSVTVLACRQWMAQIDHLVLAITEKVIGHGAGFKNSQKTASIEYLFESFDHPDSPQINSIQGGFRSFAGTTK